MTDTPTKPHWVTAFLDFPAEGLEDGTRFWLEVAGHRLSSRRGDAEEFATLLPDEGDAFLRVQRVNDGGPRVHLDLHVVDAPAALRNVLALGAELVADHGDWGTARSPGGLPFCLVSHRGARRPPPLVLPSGAMSLVDQVAIDIPSNCLDEERTFWSAVTGWEVVDLPRAEFSRLAVPDEQPLRFLLHRLDEQEGPVRAHLDLATDDRPIEVARHVRLGATEGRASDHWTVMKCPGGMTYCITDRRPYVTG